jgi:hypothetical protein
LARIPRLDEQLGWIKSSSIAVASRAVNVLRCGRSVRDFESLTKADLILLQLPDTAVEHTIAALASSGLYWPGKSVALMHPVLDSSALSLLERRGATAACFSLLSDTPPKFLVEGHPDAVRRLRKLLKSYQTTVLEIERGRKGDYLAGVYASTAELVPLFAGAIDHLRRAGLQKADAESTAASMFETSIRAYLRVGKRLLERTMHSNAASRASSRSQTR